MSVHCKARIEKETKMAFVEQLWKIRCRATLI